MSKEYRDWIREQPCCVTGYHDIQDPHHIKGYSYLFRNCKPGNKSKISDLACIPLKHELHNELHNNGWKSFEEKYNMNQLEEVIKHIIKAEKLGIIKA